MRIWSAIGAFCLIICLSFSTTALGAAIGGEKRIALVIGNSNYQSSSSLDNPANDAELMARTLSNVGFIVTKVIDANRFDMRKAMLEYSRSLQGSDTVGVFYYAGHGIQVDGQNYLLPVDAAPARKDELSLLGVALSEFMRTLNSVSGSDGRLNVVILDACRNNPFARGWRSVTQGLATIDAPSGTLIAFATSPGDVAADGEGDNSPYTLALTEMIKKPGIAIEQTFKGARNLVWKWTKKSGKAQIPWETTSLRGDFYFTPAKAHAKKSIEKDATQHKGVREKGEPIEMPETQVATRQKRAVCQAIQSSFETPIAIKPGQILCSPDQAHKAIIKTIRKRAIIFSVNGEKNVVCTIRDLCQFNWPNAPLFNVVINTKKTANGKYSGFLKAVNR